MLTTLFSAVTIPLDGRVPLNEMPVHCFDMPLSMCVQLHLDVGIALLLGIACTLGLILTVLIHRVFPSHKRLVTILMVIFAAGPLLALVSQWLFCGILQWPNWVCASLVVTQLIVFPVIAGVYSLALRKKKLDGALKRLSVVFGIACGLFYSVFVALYFLS